MPNLPITTFGADVLQPWSQPDLARTLAVNLEAGTYAKGTIVGEVVNASAQNEQQTLTTAGTVTGGTFTLTLDGITTAPIVWNATAAQVVAALTAAFGAAIATASGGALPATPVVLTFINEYAARDVALLVVGNSLTGTGGPGLTPSETAKGRAASGTFKAYVDAASDGSGIAKGILQYACVVDSRGRVYIGNQTGGGELGNYHLTAPIFTRGVFRTSDCVGLDAAALVDLAAHFESGNLAQGGVFSF